MSHPEPPEQPCSGACNAPAHVRVHSFSNADFTSPPELGPPDSPRYVNRPGTEPPPLVPTDATAPELPSPRSPTRVQVRNTFIEVEEPGNPILSFKHLRSASEPMQPMSVHCAAADGHIGDNSSVGGLDSIGSWMRASVMVEARTSENSPGGVGSSSSSSTYTHGHPPLHLRQPSMTIDECDVEDDLMGLGPNAASAKAKSVDLGAARAVYATSHVQVRNTFIEVQEVPTSSNESTGSPQTRPHSRLRHLRCASEPMQPMSFGVEPMMPMSFEFLPRDDGSGSSRGANSGTNSPSAFVHAHPPSSASHRRQKSMTIDEVDGEDDAPNPQAAPSRCQPTRPPIKLGPSDEGHATLGDEGVTGPSGTGASIGATTEGARVTAALHEEGGDSALPAGKRQSPSIHGQTKEPFNENLGWNSGNPLLVLPPAYDGYPLQALYGTNGAWQPPGPFSHSMCGSAALRDLGAQAFEASMAHWNHALRLSAEVVAAVPANNFSMGGGIGSTAASPTTSTGGVGVAGATSPNNTADGTSTGPLLSSPVVAPAQKGGRMRSPTGAARTAKQPSQCKWFIRGTCKFGAECRYNHTAKPLGNCGQQKGPAPHRAASLGVRQRSPQPPREARAESQAAPPLQRSSSISAGSTTAGSNASAYRASSLMATSGRAHCQVIWCDQRAFKEDSVALRSQLEAATHMPAKAHKTAEKCIRLLQKKRRSREKVQARPLSVFLISWANAPMLVQYLAEASHIVSKVVVLCDMCGNRVRDAAERWAVQYPLVEKVAATWQEAVVAAAAATTATTTATTTMTARTMPLV